MVRHSSGFDPRGLLSQPLSRLLVLAFFTTALLPTALLAIHFYDFAWQGAWREAQSRHQLQATELAGTVGLYAARSQWALTLVGATLRNLDPSDPGQRELIEGLSGALGELSGFSALSLIDNAGGILAGPNLLPVGSTAAAPNPDQACIRLAQRSGQRQACGVHPSWVNGLPVLLMVQPVAAADQRSGDLLLGELPVEPIERLRSSRELNQRAYAAVIDQHGRIIAHPNREWSKAMHRLPEAQALIERLRLQPSGVSEFHSVSQGSNMVVGYAGVPGTNWAVLVAEPRAQVAVLADALVRPQIAWAAMALLLAVAVGLVLARALSQPLSRLAAAATQMVRTRFHGELEVAAHQIPREVGQLGVALSELDADLQASRRENEALSRSVEERVAVATRPIREANERLERLVRLDHVTGLWNRRHLDQDLPRIAQRCRRDGRPACLMLIDIDHFKNVNDVRGHAAGDYVLNELAKLLQRAMRAVDLLARYGGDEFAVFLQCEPATAKVRAQKLLDTVAAHHFVWKGEPIKTSVSIGLLIIRPDTDSSLEEMLFQADRAMYLGKDRGRNRVAVFDNRSDHA